MYADQVLPLEYDHVDRLFLNTALKASFLHQRRRMPISRKICATFRLELPSVSGPYSVYT